MLGFLLTLLLTSEIFAQPQQFNIGFITKQEPYVEPLSLLDVKYLNIVDPRITDLTVSGALQALKENETTGSFTNQSFTMAQAIVAEDGNLVDEFSKLVGGGAALVLADLHRDDLLELADSDAGKNVVLFNLRAHDNDLRSTECRVNVFHVAPSRSMLTDGLAQYLVWKRWNKWFLVVGKHAGDKAYADALKLSAKKFGAKIVDEKEWMFDAGARRTDSGHVTAQQEVPAATQGDEHDVLIVADEADEFGEYLPYRTFAPRPVAGTQGLTPTIWHRAHEQWGGTQLQRRFFRKTKRDMTPRDYAAWMAMRAIGEAATQAKDTDVKVLKEFMLGDRFKLAAFKGVALTFRNWNGQLRQPVLVAAPRMLVSVSPQKEFLHQFSPLDTLGLDRPESKCDKF